MFSPRDSTRFPASLKHAELVAPTKVDAAAIKSPLILNVFCALSSQFHFSFLWTQSSD
ncbi:hypothetical protein PSAB6_230395 [Paraburkholderia sabiae]|nr:hypothetical protein PSAB6_230395 [Paraburkholderia sabiae]